MQSLKLQRWKRNKTQVHWRREEKESRDPGVLDLIVGYNLSVKSTAFTRGVKWQDIEPPEKNNLQPTNAPYLPLLKNLIICQKGNY